MSRRSTSVSGLRGGQYRRANTVRAFSPNMPRRFSLPRKGRSLDRETSLVGRLFLASRDDVDFDRVRRNESGDHGRPSGRIVRKIFAEKAVVGLKVGHLRQVHGGLHHAVEVKSDPGEEPLDVLEHLAGLALETARWHGSR